MVRKINTNKYIEKPRMQRISRKLSKRKRILFLGKKGEEFNVIS